MKNQKHQLRELMLSQRESLDPGFKTAYDQNICKSLFEVIQNRGASNIHTYLPMGSEIDLQPLIHRLLETQHTVIAAKTLRRRQLEHLVLHSLDEVESGIFGTKHPATKEVYRGSYDIIIVPGLAFDRDNYRLGYGGGYYDTFLGQQLDAWTIAACYPFQQVERVPRESFDVAVDEVLTYTD